MSDLTDVEVTYVAGTWVAIAAADTWLLVDLPPNNSMVMSLWALLRAHAPVDAVLDALVSGGISSAPGFALVQISAEERRVVVRGSASVHLVASEGQMSLAAAPGVAWSDNPLPAAVQTISLACASWTDSPTQLPMGSGVTAAGGVQLRVSSGWQSQPAVAPLKVEQPVINVEGPEPDSEPELEAGSWLVIEPDMVLAPIDEVAHLAPEDPPSATNSYDVLFGKTISPPPPETWNAPLLEPVPMYEESVSLMVEDVPPVDERSSQTQDWASVHIPDEGDLIDSVPWLVDNQAVQPGAASPSSAQVPVPASPHPAREPVTSVEPRTPGNEMEILTVNRADLLVAASGAGPQVLAVYCPSLHLTAAHSATCRVCGVPVAQQDAVPIPRPPLGVLRLPNGDQVVLDKGVLFGRVAQADPSAPERPHEIRLTTPDNEISRNHAEVVLDGWNVLVRDLGSMNGTTVALPGREPLRLRSNDLFPLEPNSVICLAEQLEITFEVTP